MVSAVRGAGEAQGRGSWGGVGMGGAAADAVDITAESARLSRRCGYPRAFSPPHFTPPLQPQAGVWAGQRQGVGRRVGGGEGKVVPSPAPLQSR